MNEISCKFARKLGVKTQALKVGSPVRCMGRLVAPQHYQHRVRELLLSGRSVAGHLTSQYNYRRAIILQVFPHLSELAKVSIGAAGTKGNVWEHTLAVVEVLESILTGSIPFNNRKQGESIEDAVLNDYRNAVAEIPSLDRPLREELFLLGILHDLGNIFGRSGHAAAGVLPAKKILENLMITPRLLEEICWLIGNHDGLGPMYFGERLPQLLYRSLEGLTTEEKARRLTLLAVFTLCDVRGTARGQYLTNEKAKFYLDFARGQVKIKEPAEVVEYRLVRFSGSDDGEPWPERAGAARVSLETLQSEQKAILVKNFGSLLFLDYGFPNFRILKPENIIKLALIISLIMERETEKGNPISRVAFTWGWPNPNVAAAFKAALDGIEAQGLTSASIGSIHLSGFSIIVEAGGIIFKGGQG